MPVVATGVLSSPVPGIWRRLSLISSDESIRGLRAERLIGQLEIPRHQHDLVHLLQSWERACVPPDVALALWLLREQEDGHGRIYRRSAIPVEESSPAIRYIQLATEVGETMDTDPTLRRVVSWLLERQLPDGSIPLVISTGNGQIGQTCRALRALGRLADPALEEHLDAMDSFLRTTPIGQAVGHAWSYSKIDDTAVTGSTSLAALALLERDDGPSETVTEGLRYLMATQDAQGGWAEVPGYRPTIQNTQHAVRTLRAAQDAGLFTDEIPPVLDRARRWFLRTVRHRPPRSTLDLSFAVRIGVELGLLLDKRIETLGRQLVQRRRHTLSTEADMYAETELSAIALMECSRRLDGIPGAASSWDWRWRLPPLPPPFLVRGTYLYELLYSLVKKRWWVRVVDALVNARIIDRIAALLLGTITALGVVDDHITNALRSSGGDFRTDVTIAIVGVLLLLWLGVKTTARSSVLGAAYGSIGSLGIAALLTWLLYTPGLPVFVVISLLGLRWLIVDVVAFAAAAATAQPAPPEDTQLGRQFAAIDTADRWHGYAHLDDLDSDDGDDVSVPAEPDTRATSPSAGIIDSGGRWVASRRSDPDLAENPTSSSVNVVIRTNPRPIRSAHSSASPLVARRTNADLSINQVVTAMPGTSRRCPLSRQRRSRNVPGHRL